MEKEKLIIKNFGPIKEVDLDLGKVTVLIGEQATGKSTVAKVLAVCRYFSFIVEETRTRNQSVFTDGIEQWGLLEYQKEDTLIEYHCEHYSLIYEYNASVEKILYDDEGKEIGTEEVGFQLHLSPKSGAFKNLIAELKKVAPRSVIKTGSMTLSLFRNVPTSFYLNDVKNVMDNPFYFPTERGLQSVFSLGQSGIKNLENALFNYFSKVDTATRFFKNDTEIEPLGIRYVNRNGLGFVKNDKHDYLELSKAASGYQSAIPIVLVVDYQIKERKKSKTFIIEEPELNLFPNAQNRLVQYLIDRTVNSENRLLLTTHSPYTLTSLNNLMYAYVVGQQHPEEVTKEIDKKYWINPDDVSAYMLTSDGYCEDIVDREESMIKAEKIDGISKVINKTFNKLMNIELGINESNS